MIYRVEIATVPDGHAVIYLEDIRIFYVNIVILK